MTVGYISWSISTKECCRPRRGLNPRPPGLQLDGASTRATEANHQVNYNDEAGVDPGWFLRGFDLIKLPCFLYVFGQTDHRKQCRPRSDAGECSIWSGSTLFATHSAILHTLTGSKMDDEEKYSYRCEISVKFSIPNLSKISNESQRWGWGWGWWCREGIQLNSQTPS